ncbi:hypothetical protein PPROV_000656800 [Pycnococcus provasolii]|uniref:Uncharacterized protein n=1 Tax=Pycnococcus provasolii TaxID=41880 RepID=A0A830HKC0_9CHLO|nr:hypothetical protein PPROV_000656800 [Pycnococcus provasolii]
MAMAMTVSLVAAAVAALMMIVVQAGAAAAATTTSLPNPWPRRFKAHTLTYFPTNKNQVVVQLAAMFFDSTEQRQRFDHVVTRGQPLRPNSSRITTEIWRPRRHLPSSSNHTTNTTKEYEFIMIDEIERTCAILIMPFGPPRRDWMSNKKNCVPMAEGAKQLMERDSLAGKSGPTALIGHGLTNFHTTKWTRCSDPAEMPFDYYTNEMPIPARDLPVGGPYRLTAPVGGTGKLRAGVIHFYNMMAVKAFNRTNLFDIPPHLKCQTINKPTNRRNNNNNDHHMMKLMGSRMYAHRVLKQVSKHFSTTTNNNNATASMTFSRELDLKAHH